MRDSPSDFVAHRIVRKDGTIVHQIRDWSAFLAYVVLIASIWFDIHISTTNENRLHSQGIFAAQQRNTIVHNQGIIIHNQGILCATITMIATESTGHTFSNPCVKLRNDFEP